MEDIFNRLYTILGAVILAGVAFCNRIGMTGDDNRIMTYILVAVGVILLIIGAALQIRDYGEVLHEIVIAAALFVFCYVFVTVLSWGMVIGLFILAGIALLFETGI